MMVMVVIPFAKIRFLPAVNRDITTVNSSSHSTSSSAFAVKFVHSFVPFPEPDANVSGIPENGVKSPPVAT